MEGIPRDHDTEDILRNAVVRRCDDVAFLATLTVDDLQGLLHGTLSLLVPHHLHRVHRPHERVFARFRVSQAPGIGTRLMRDERANPAGLVGMRLLKHGQADKLVRWQVVVEPFERVHGKLGPVGITTRDEVRVCVGMSHLIRVPAGLAAGRTDVLGRARDGDDVRGAILHLEVIDTGLLLLPRLLIVEGVELDIVDWAGPIDNGSLAVEEGEHLVALLDVVLVRSDRDNLVSGELVVPDPLLQLTGVCHCVSTLEDLKVRISARSTVLDHRQQEFKLIMRLPFLISLHHMII